MPLALYILNLRLFSEKCNSINSSFCSRQARVKDSDTPFNVRDAPEGTRVRGGVNQIPRLVCREPTPYVLYFVPVGSESFLSLVCSLFAFPNLLFRPLFAEGFFLFSSASLFCSTRAATEVLRYTFFWRDRYVND